MDTNEHELYLKDDVFQIIGCAMAVLNEIGRGFVEKPYENGVVAEFSIRNMQFRQQPHYDVVDK